MRADDASRDPRASALRADPMMRLDDTQPVLMVLDDDPAMVNTIILSFRRDGLAALGATDGITARGMLAAHPSIHVLVSDIRMPGVDGVTLAGEFLRDRSEENALEVVLISGQGTMDDAVAALRIGVTDFLSKPVRLADLRAACLVALARSARRRAAARAAATTIAPFDEARVRLALERGEIVPFLQPIVSVADGRLAGFEALARWLHPEHGLLAPATFLPPETAPDLAASLDLHIAGASIAATEAWRRAGRFRGTLQVNISPASLTDPGLITHLGETLRRSQADVSHLLVEVTEHSALTDDGLAMLRRLAAMGLRIALDDFGAGFSALQLLAELPVHMVKLDRDFVQSCRRDQAAGLLGDLATFAHTRRLTVVAEGIETQADWDALAPAGIDYAQGWHCGPPLDLRAAEAHAGAAMRRVH